MLESLLSTMNTEQRQKLAEFGLSKQQITNIKSGRNLPTELQVIALADVFGVDRFSLQDEVTLRRATPEQRTLLQRVMGKARGGLTAALAGLLVAAASAGAGMVSDNAFAARLRRRLKRANVSSVKQTTG